MNATDIFSPADHLPAPRLAQRSHSPPFKRRVIGAILLALMGSIVFAECANATAWIYVPDVSQLQYQTTGNLVYFRNFNQFNASALGCCYNYWIDTTTTEGRNTFALIMAAAAQAKPMYFGVPDGYASGVLTESGIW